MVEICVIDLDFMLLPRILHAFCVWRPYHMSDLVMHVSATKFKLLLDVWFGFFCYVELNCFGLQLVTLTCRWLKLFAVL